MFYIVFWTSQNFSYDISTTRCPTEIGFGSKCGILNGQVNYTQKLNLNIADMWPISLGRVTYVTQRQLMRLFAVKLILSYKQKCKVRSKFLKN